ncbi:unnamed protein product [Cylicocyclus nassatus]|uniref:Uncharacterized protein n=1 Tax=Cylicocyclus nassatus TaxID=53992 RepID=A0AA36DV15_CYLNA|nr:unnamed protein product [Cylicocyclus nassatus]
MNVEQHFPNSLLIFDTVGNDQVALLMTRRQSPDSSIMTYPCGAPQYYCAKMPRWVVSSSNFFMGDRSMIPFIIQVDHESKMSKMELFRKENFLFMKDDGSCNASSIVHLKEAVSVALDEVRVEVKDEEMAVLDYVLWNLHRWFGLDPYNNKNFLRVHEGII